MRKDGCFLPKIRNEARFPTLNDFYSTCLTRGSSQNNATRQRNKRYKDWKGRNRTAFIFAHNTTVYTEKLMTSTKTLLALINEFKSSQGKRAI